MRAASSTDVPDTTSGFRAYNREAAIQMLVVNKFTYTLETIIQAGKLLVATDHVAIRTNPATRESRLFPSMWAYVRRNAVSIFRIYAQYEPLRVFMGAAALLGLAAHGGLDSLPRRLHRRQRQRPRAVTDPRRGAVQRRHAAGGARRDRRSACGAAGDDAEDLRTRPAHRAAARRAAVTLRARGADRRRGGRPAARHEAANGALPPDAPATSGERGRTVGV